MKPPIIVAGIALAVIVALGLVIRSRFAQSGTLAEVPTRLARLKKDTDPKAFLGFCTCDADALYYVYERGAFFLDYELTTPEKKSHEDAFLKIAAEMSLAVTNTTYGDYPVLRVKAGDSEGKAAEVGLDFAGRLFGYSKKTAVEFLP